ncbi:phage integrase N-terminal SAM-like domain-containing protein [Chromohalobacter moromii]|uniref:Phage integrase N-terminal SAM-like domain-containing protein n=1 Tax=Chromohalobacter moromii TaxID=2860329 RepID=A0A9X2X187_9GAMM|nr:phage integrase N-terminal SAM-like domain-containing protein [Chromohalobacter moromii]MCT8504738.1 phage integrase N-terminal SAM-like domain-containing protein [Chromohalobacter moromii]
MLASFIRVEGETLQPAHREDLLLLDTLFHRFNGLCHPASMDCSEVKAFLEHLAVQRHVAAATQNQP